MSELTIKLEVTGLDGLVQVLTALLGKVEGTGTGSAASIMQQNSEPIQQQVGLTSSTQTQTASGMTSMQASVQNGFVSQNAVPVSNALPTQQLPVNGALPTGVPTTAMPQEFTQDQLSVAAAGLVNQGKQARLLELLHSFGANSLVELPRERYGEFATALRAEGAVI